MKTYFNLRPRQTGKTTTAVYEFLKSPEDTLYICKDEKRCKDVVKKFNLQKYSNNFIGSESINNIVLTRKPKNIILDEYLFFDNYERVYKTIKESSFIENLHIFSSVREIYNKKIFDFVKACKKHNHVHDYTSIWFNTGNKKSLSKEEFLEIEELFVNFLTEPGLVFVDYSLTDFYAQQHLNRIKMIGEYTFAKEYLNVYLKDEITF